MGKNNTKRLFFDEYSSGIINHLLTPEDLKSKDIDRERISRINEKEKGLDVLKHVYEDVVAFIIKPDREVFNIVVEINLMLKAIRQNLIVYLIFIPKENYDIIEYMSSNNMIEDFIIENFNIDLIPIDIDLLSLENENSIKELYIENNMSCISDLANAVVKLETCFGKFKYKYIKGDLAKTFCDNLEEKEKEYNNRISEDEEIFGMIVLDRSVDFITLMTTNYTCEGIIDQNIGINLGRIKIKESILKENENPPKNKISSKKPKVKSINTKVERVVPYGLTTDKNPYFCSFRCMHYLDALKYIKMTREYYQKLATSKSSSNYKDLKTMTDQLNHIVNTYKKDLVMNENLMNYVVEPLLEKEFIKYIEKEQLLLAGDLPDRLYNYYEENLCEQKDLASLIKLMVIESLTQDGIQGYQKLKREILNIYGFQKIFLFRDLESLGWLKEKQLLKKLKNLTEITYNQISEKLDLINQNTKKNIIEDCSYVLSGYCPISLKIIEKGVRGKWSSIIDILKKMPGVTSYPDNEKLISDPKTDNNIMFIVFIGGVTYTEIEGIRFLNRIFKEEYLKGKRKKTQFIIVTTGILNSKKIIDNLGKDVKSPLTMRMFYDQNRKGI